MFIYLFGGIDYGHPKLCRTGKSVLAFTFEVLFCSCTHILLMDGLFDFLIMDDSTVICYILKCLLYPALIYTMPDAS
jgi:hypothetical protein